MSINTGLSNYYGHVGAWEEDGKFYIFLEDWNGLNQIEISEKFFLAMMEEFGENK